MGRVSVWDAKSFRNEKTIGLGQNVVNTVGLTPDGKFAVVPISTADQALRVRHRILSTGRDRKRRGQP